MDKKTNLVSLDRLKTRLKFVQQKMGLLREVEKIGFSEVGNKKYYVLIKDGDKKRLVHFGDKNYEDYLIHNDPERRRLYRLRHQNNDLSQFKSGRYSWFLLW